MGRPDSTPLATLCRAIADERALTTGELDALAAALAAPSASDASGRDALLGLLAASRDPATHRALGALPAGFTERDALWWMAAAQSEDSRVEHLLDALLEGADAAGLIEALARASVPWAHPAIEDALHANGATRQAAAALLAGADPDALLDWHDALLDGEDQDEAFEVIIETMRAAALLQEDFSWEELVELRASCDEEDPEAASALARIDAAMATVEPLQFARRVMMGASSLAWCSNPALVADALCARQGSTWLETLALLELGGDPEAFELGALIALSAAPVEPIPEHSDEALTALIEALEARDPTWEMLAARQGFQIPLAFADEDTAPLLVSCAAHDRALALGFEAPPIPGLALSSTDANLLDLDTAIAMIESAATQDDPSVELIVALVRTLCDARRWAEEEPELIEPFLEHPALHDLVESPVLPIQYAAAWLLDEAFPGMPEALIALIDDDAEALEPLALGSSPLALYLDQQLVVAPTLDALDTLARRAAEGDLLRAPVRLATLLAAAELFVSAEER